MTIYNLLIRFLRVHSDTTIKVVDYGKILFEGSFKQMPKSILNIDVVIFDLILDSNYKEYIEITVHI